MHRAKILHLIASQTPCDPVCIKGWVRTRRDSRNFSFIEINDGSCLANIQVIAAETLHNYDEIRRLTTGSAVAVTGSLVASTGKGQQWEIRATSVEILGLASENFPLQKKRHTDEYLRTIAHLRPRTNKYGAAMRLRSDMAWAIHAFFRERGFCYIHTPIITASDCEGAGELFRVTTLNPASDAADPKAEEAGNSRDFFGAEANLTVSGQLSAEMLALALGDVYTFGPTFRAENSNTRRHAAEFWMVEPEMAFCDLAGNMDLAESLIRSLVSFAMEQCRQDLDLFARFVDPTLMTRLATIAENTFVRVSYAEAVNLLSQSGHPFEFPVSYGCDLQTEHERYLTESCFRKPVIVYNYPKEIKPFYMRLNDDGQTVAAMDVLVPVIGEIIGGSQREERLEVLETRMRDQGLDHARYWWYLDSRRFGSVAHSGFGMGFERLLMLVTGISNIRDVIPFPRTPGSIEF
jgi:asparaginyl-tRNA synthetase